MYSQSIHEFFLQHFCVDVGQQPVLGVGGGGGVRDGRVIDEEVTGGGTLGLRVRCCLGQTLSIIGISIRFMSGTNLLTC